MRIAGWVHSENADTQEVSAEIDGYRLWFRLPRSLQVSTSGDPFLASALLPAMVRGEAIEIDPALPVSPKFLEKSRLIQEIHHCWNPVLARVPVSATTSPARPLNPGVLLFFSGGVDSEYTFLKHNEEISHVVFMHGMDFYHSRRQGPTISLADISDLADFATKLHTPRDPVSAFLKGKFSTTTRRLLSDYLASGREPGALEAALLGELNGIIAGPCIFTAERFRGVALRPRTARLVADVWRAENTNLLNSLLLADAFKRQIAGDDNRPYQQALERNASFVQSYGKTLIPLESNHYAFGYRYNLSRNLTQGGVLASVALILGFRRAYVSSFCSWAQLIPMGSHPLTDPLYSNECVEIIHDGAEARRVDKVRQIAASPSALANLRVCFEDMNVNCGRCEKCLRTMIPLTLSGAVGAPFPPLPLKEIRSLRFSAAFVKVYFEENLDLAVKVGNKELRDALTACMRRNERRQLILEFDRVILGGIMRRTRGRSVGFGEGFLGGRRFDRIQTTPHEP